MTKQGEFNLSDKIVYYQDNGEMGESAIMTEDVREFIRRLKERYKEFGDVQDCIDELAGDKLK